MIEKIKEFWNGLTPAKKIVISLVIVCILILLFTKQCGTEKVIEKEEEVFVEQRIESTFIAFEHIHRNNLWWLEIYAIDQMTMDSLLANWQGPQRPEPENYIFLGRMSAEMIMMARGRIASEDLDTFLHQHYSETVRELAGLFVYHYSDTYFCEYWEILYATVEDVQKFFTFNATTGDTVNRNFDGLIEYVYNRVLSERINE